MLLSVIIQPLPHSLPAGSVCRSAEKTKSHRQDKVTLLFSQSGSVLSVASQLSLRNSGIADRTVFIVGPAKRT